MPLAEPARRERRNLTAEIRGQMKNKEPPRTDWKPVLLGLALIALLGSVFFFWRGLRREDAIGTAGVAAALALIIVGLTLRKRKRQG